MTFIQPAFLWGVTAVVIPVIIHFLELRRFRKQYFSDNYFLVDLLKKKRKQEKIKQWLVLLSRILFIVLLSMAFAQPVRRDEKNLLQTSRAVLYLDNSLSMQSYDQQMSLLERAKQFAARLVDQLPSQTQWLVLTNDEMYPTWMLPEEAKNKIKNIQVSPFSVNYDLVIKKWLDFVGEDQVKNTYFFLLTDFQRSQGKLAGLANFQGNTFLIPFWGIQRKNIAVDSTWLESLPTRDGGRFILTARIINYSDESFEQFPVSVFLNQTLVATSLIQISSRGQTDVKFDVGASLPDVYSGYVEIDDPIVPFDNRCYFGFRALPSIPVMHIAGKGSTKVLPAIFADEKIFQFRTYLPSQPDYEFMKSAKLIVLEEVDYVANNLINKIREHVTRGGMVAILPPQKKELRKNYEQLLEGLGIPIWLVLDTGVSRVIDLQSKHFLFRGVFVTPPDEQSIIHVRKHYLFSATTGIPVLSMANKHPFLLDFPVGKGHVFVLSVPLSEEFSDLPSNALVVPLFMQMAFKTEAIPVIEYSLEEESGIALNVPFIQQEQPPLIKMKERTYFPSFTHGNPLQIFLNKSIQEPGVAEVWYGNNIVSVFGLNYSRRESNPDSYSIQELDSLIGNSTHIQLIKEGEKISVARMKEILTPSIAWWKWFLLGSLVFLLVEILLLRLWK